MKLVSVLMLACLAAAGAVETTSEISGMSCVYDLEPALLDSEKHKALEALRGVWKISCGTKISRKDLW